MAEGQIVRSFSVGPIRTKEEASRRPTTPASVGDQLARRFYDARPRLMSRDGGPDKAMSWEDAQEEAPDYIADLRLFGRIAVGLEG